MSDERSDRWFDDWLESYEGVVCGNAELLAYEAYLPLLTERLRAAFRAGVEYERRTTGEAHSAGD